MLVGLVSGSLSPEDANGWACPFVLDEGRHPEPMDSVVWNALGHICGADLEVAPAKPLHGQQDFTAWLEAFRREAAGK